jgi:hypothetical protein
MTTQIFAIDQSNLKRLEKFWKRAPRQFQAATGMLLNNFAYGTREEILKYLPEKMTIRKEAFMRARVKYRKTSTAIPIDSQESEVGSTYIGNSNFSGWAEQEARFTTKRKHLATIPGRRGKKEKIIPKKYRINRRFKKSKEYPGDTGQRRTFLMLQILQREGFQDPFIINEHPKFRKGLYQFKSGILQMLVEFEPDKLQPKALAWLSESRARYFGGINMTVEWGKVLQRILKF